MSVNPTALRREMIARGLSVATLAKKAGVSENAVLRMLRPDNNPKLDTEQKVAAVLASVPAKPGLAEAFQAIAS